MGIQVVWDDEGRSIIRWEFQATWDWDDFQRACDRSLEMARSVDYRIDVISYTSDTEKLPPGTLTHFKRVYDEHPENTHLIVITGGNVFVNSAIKMASRVYRIPSWRTAKTLEEARDTITQDRQNG